jgi:hypothetical protein
MMPTLKASLLATSLLCLCWRHPALAQLPSNTIALAQLRDDLERLRYTFERAHAGLYRYTPKEHLDSAFDRVTSQLVEPKTELEFLRLLVPLIDLVRDAHTTVRPSAPTLQYIGRQARVFPLNVRYARERAFVERNVSADSGIPLGGEILSINGRPMREITRTILSAKTADGVNQAPKYQVANVNFWISYFELVDTSAAFVVEIRNPRTGDTRRHTIAGVSPALVQRGQRQFPTAQAFSLQFISDSSLAVMRIPDFGDLRLKQAFAESFHQIRTANARTLIIDLRNNPGGYDELNTELLSYLVPYPYRFYDDFTFRATEWNDLQYATFSPDDFWNTADLTAYTEPQRAERLRTMTLAEVLQHNTRGNPAAGMHQPKQADAFRGSLYVLVNGRSNSSAAEIPALLHFLGVGTLIGEEPNAAYQGTTGGIILILTLPASGIRVTFPLVAYHNAVLPGLLLGRGAPPHFAIDETVEDAIEGRDTVMEFALRLIEARTNRQ